MLVFGHGSAVADNDLAIDEWIGAVLQTETLDAVADRGYFSSPEILACQDRDRSP